MSDEESVPPVAIAPGTISTLLLKLAHAPPRRIGSACPSFRPGQIVGPLEVVREIGRGGFGVVYEAHDRRQGRSVALKALRIGGQFDPKEERLLREADAAARLSHPNIVTVLDAGQAEVGPYLVLELLKGRTLGERLTAGPVPVGEALRIGVEVAAGVAHAHAQGVIHRDLTPGNVFLCDDGLVKVLDFGMAHAFGLRKLEGGTRAYMAPEQRRGAPEDERTDVFALGVILYQMLSGEAPFPEGGALRGQEAPRLEVSGLPALGEQVARMLEVDPVERPRDAEQVLSALARFRQDIERTPSVEITVRVRRRRLGAVRSGASVGLGALLVAAGAVAWLRGPARTGEASIAAPSSTHAEVAVVTDGQTSPSSKQPDATEREGLENHLPAAGRQGGGPARRILRCSGALGAIPTPPLASGDGVLTIVAEPFGGVFVNGRRRGETPAECRVPAGAYVVRVVHPHFGTREARVEVAPGQRTTWMADFLEGR